MSVALESRGNLGGEARRKLRQRNVKLAARRKRQTAPSQNGLYVHSSPPRAVQVNPSLIRQWLRSGDIDKLEQVILEGQGNKLFGEYSPEPRTRAFLRTVPQFLSKIDSLHSSVVNNNLGELTQGLEGDEKVMLGRKDIILAKDKTGLTVLHKAVGLGHQDIAAWLTSAYPTLLNVKDREGRNPLHYSACGPNPEDMWDVIAGAGADQSLVDNQGHSPPYYLDHPEQIKLPEGDDSPPTRNRFLNSRDGLNVTRANIRIWIHDRDLGRLQQVLWDGNGSKLRVETSNNPRVKRFLDAVPYIMGTIKDTHQAVINNDQAFLEKRTEDPVPANILATKDQNGLTPLHKAAGLGHKEMVEWMVERFPNGINLQDSQGRTPLHWAAKDSKTYNLLLDNGANTSIVDQKSHEPSYYKGKPSELDGRLLRVVPEAPRTTSAFPPAWDWRMLNHFSYDSYSNPVLNDQVHGNGEPWSQMPSRVDKRIDEAEVLTLQQDFDPTTPSVDRMSYNHRPNTSTPSGADKQIELEDGVEDDEGVGDDDVIGEDRLADRSPSPTREDTDRTDDSGMHDPGSGGSENENDPEVNALIESSDMEGLASLVLNGQGWRLLNMRSGDTELQTFLSNVPQYMAKIRTVHVAAREGRLRDLQGSLDRRKFAVARDPEVSGMGATPLHVAALFGHTNIVRYLGARFPETLNARDNNGKTPLHYAATIKDNGHYYNLLTNLGANAAIKDLNGKPASYYQSHPQELTHEMLLHDFGLTQEDSSAATDLLRDQRHISHHGRNSEHSLYLQKELSSPLSRGLHEVVNVRPTDPVGYLGSYLTNYTRARSRVGFQEPATRTSTGFGAPIMTAIATGGVAAIATGGVAAAAAGVGAAASAGGAAVSTTGRVAASTAGRAAATATSFSSRSQPPPTSLHHRQTVQTGTSALDANALAAAEATALINDPNSERADTPISPDTAFSSTNRDEHGQSMLHFAAARAHGRNALLELLHEASISVAYRDELYRTARDVAIQANLPENIRDIDRYVVSLAATGETQKLAELLIEGYDHIVDLDEEDGKSIIDLAMERGHHETVDFLNSVQPFEEKRERLHEGIRQGDFATVQHLLPTSNSNSNPNLLSIGKNLYGRCSLHIATLCQYDDIAEYIAKTFPETLRQGDNLERTALHYAMGLDQVETLSTMLINAGSKRVLKDLKGRQPSYYFMNKSDILRLQADEETLKAQ